jgi:hypothetical protein
MLFFLLLIMIVLLNPASRRSPKIRIMITSRSMRIGEKNEQIRDAKVS